MSDAEQVARLFAWDPIGTGVRLCGDGPARDRFLAELRSCCGDRPWVVCPAAVTDDRLFGGLDLEATLASGRRVISTGLIAAANGGILVVRGAERLAPEHAAGLASALERREFLLDSDGTSLIARAAFGLVLLDDGLDDGPPAALLDRVAYRLDLDATSPLAGEPGSPSGGPIGDGDAAQLLCGVASTLGIASLRAAIQAMRTARGLAAMAGRTALHDVDLAVAARLVFAHRATRLPAEPVSESDSTEAAPPEPIENAGAGETAGTQSEAGDAAIGEDLSERIVRTALAAIPAGLLASSSAEASSRRSGRGAAVRRAASSGRRIGSVAGRPGRGARLDLIATLQAAAPWQRLRQSQPYRVRIDSCVIVRPSDLRIRRHAVRTGRTTVFVVDASGSAALQRLGEAKGAVERLLAECYRQRDRVALIAFRRDRAELLLPPTGALARARRSLEALAGGGGTPLASGLDAARTLAERLRARGEIPLTVLLTDGRANVSRDGYHDRVRAAADAMTSAATFRSLHLPALVIDISPRPREEAAMLAGAMGARRLALPRIDAAALSRIVRDAA